MCMKDPMKKNGLDESAASRNDHIGDHPELRTAAGAPVYSNQDSMTAGARGPIALQDQYLIEKLSHFNREVIPERRMHAKGSGAWGQFTVTHDISKFTKAKIFNKIGNKCELFMRFSTVAGERGAADAERDIRGFAMRFYTEDGNWDLVGNNTPVFFFRDPKNFIDLNHAIKRDPRTNMRSKNNNWDFWTSLPEALHQVTIVMSDRGIPSSFRYMHGFSSHAYSFINKDNERVWVKFYLRSQQGILNFTDQEAEMVVGKDRESSQNDLYNAIEQKKFPRWEMFIQVMTEEQARAMKTNPFDLTKTWSKKDFPLQPVGMLELNRNPDNYFQDVEQAAFNPANIVPGIGFSPDKMLQGRLFSYGDAQRYRLGVNHHQIPVNQPRGVAHPHSFHRDGQMRVDGNLGSEVHYEPNSYGNWHDHPELLEPKQDGGDVWTYDYREDDHYYFTQPGMLFRAMSPDQQLVLAENTARDMSDSTLQIKHRHIRHCYQADPKYGEMVAKALDIDLNSVDLSYNGCKSYQEWREEMGKDADKDVPTDPVKPKSAMDLPPEGRDTNVSDQSVVINWETDPYLL